MIDCEWSLRSYMVCADTDNNDIIIKDGDAEVVRVSLTESVHLLKSILNKIQILMTRGV